MYKGFGKLYIDPFYICGDWIVPIDILMTPRYKLKWTAAQKQSYFICFCIL